MSSVSSSVSFFTEVMKGRNILYITGPIASFNTGTFGVNDRLTANNYKSITLTGASDTTSNGLIVTPDSYFCGGAFTISVWVKFETAPTPTAAFAFFKDNNAANVAFAFFTATNLGLLINAQSIQTNNAITAPTTGTWNFYAVSYEGAGKTPNFYTNSGSTAITAPTLFAGSGPIPTAPTCVVMSTGVIGANSIISANQVVLGSMNDFKIYNFGLTEAQIQSRFKAEASKF